MTETSFTKFWQALNEELATRNPAFGEQANFGTARHLYELFGDAADSAAEHEISLRREASNYACDRMLKAEALWH